MSRKTMMTAGAVFIAMSVLIIGGLTAAGIRHMVNRPVESEPNATPVGESGELTKTSAEPTAVTLPAGTILKATLQQTVRSDQVAAGQPFWLKVNQPVTVNGMTAIPAGSRIYGEVASAKRSGRVKGRAHVTLAFRRIETDAGSHSIAAQTVTRVAQGTKKKDALIIGSGAGIGAAIGAIAGGGKGAAIGSAIGGGAGTGVVLATRGKEVQFAKGETVSVKLVEPVVISQN